MKQYEMFELTFSGEVLQDRWAEADVTCEFTCGPSSKTVHGFYDGDGTYKVRFLPDLPGAWHWKASGAVSGEGTEECAPAGGHGPVRAVDTHFEYADGGLFIPFGTTVYALASQDDALVEETLKSLQAAPFNKVRMCVFPKHYDYNHNEPPFYAFEKNSDGSWDVRRPCTAFWHRFEKILSRIQAMGIQIDLILFHPYDRWGFDALEQRDNLIYLDYLLRRLSAFPNIWWSLANEYDLSPAKSLADWEEIEAYVASHDPFHHLLSCHNCMCLWDFSRPSVTHVSIQSKALAELPRWIETWNKPVMIDECCYEGNLPHFWGSISGQEMVRRFWRCYASGAYCTHGETFLSEDEILWWARGGRLKGESPRRIAFLREIMESLPGPLTPVCEGFQRLGLMDDRQLDETLAGADEARTGFLKPFVSSIRRMPPRDRYPHLAAEHSWEAHCGEEAYLTFCDLQCYGEQRFRLPAGRTYRAELIDVWNMTREVIAENVTGETVLKLPGRENLAVLLTRMQ